MCIPNTKKNDNQYKIELKDIKKILVKMKKRKIKDIKRRRNLKRRLSRRLDGINNSTEWKW